MRYLSGRVAGKRIDEDQECPFWVKSRHFAVQSRCPLYPNDGHAQNGYFPGISDQLLTALAGAMPTIR